MLPPENRDSYGFKELNENRSGCKRVKSFMVLMHFVQHWVLFYVGNEVIIVICPIWYRPCSVVQV